MPAINITPPFICDPPTIPAIPTLPSGISLSAALPIPSVPFGVRLCCKSIQFDPLSLLPIPPVVTAAAMVPMIVLLNTYITIINSYLNAYPKFCPKG